MGVTLCILRRSSFVLCSLPTIYNPHDLQHLHYPQFWTPSDIAWRETIYPAGCRFAHTVVVGSQWIKDDVIRQYRISPEKVQVIPEAPPTQWPPAPAPEFLTTVQNKYQLKQPFALYPAVTWPHKNHLRLLEALAYLRDACGLTLHLVCTGARQDFWPHIERRIDELNLGPQVKFLGFIPEEELRAVYRLSQFLVMPSLFEAISLPIFDAWAEGVPVVCSNATALPEQVQDAAVLFDPHSVEAIAHAIAKVATSVELQQRLRERGAQRVKDFHWERTARAYRAVYRRAAHFPLTEEDRWLLSLGLDADSSKNKGGTFIMEKRFIPVAAPVLNGNEKAYVLDCLESTWISSTGKYIEQFEAAFAEFCGVQHALSCSNGTTALHLALLALGIGPGDEVIVPTLTFVATANAVTYCGARPVFVDAEPETWNIDPHVIEAKITPRTKGIIVVHLFGHPVDMDAVSDHRVSPWSFCGRRCCPGARG